MPDLLITGEASAPTTMLLAHGSGVPMDSPFMTAFATFLAARHYRVARFEFAYMAARRTGGGRRPPPRAEHLIDEFEAAVSALGSAGRLIVGGKSLGGRVASLAAQRLYDAGAIAGVLCLGYPFHPPKKLQSLRTAHLETLTAPMLICQGERDPFGTRAEVAGYALAEPIQLHWIDDGDHDLAPRKASGLTAEDNQRAAVGAIAAWVDEL
ncbi:MAG: alpha/beta family hydrolase [Methyloligellaceae bacterium]